MHSAEIYGIALVICPCAVVIKRIANIASSESAVHDGANAQWLAVLLIELDTFIFSDSPGKSVSQADYFSASYTHSLQKQLLISAADCPSSPHASQVDVTFRRPQEAARRAGVDARPQQTTRPACRNWVEGAAHPQAA
ncbi:hypothetical protein [Paraburkholderia tropica]|uniref:hypothetical protein n=1 Tax=Paraburkholderia tropica TaxID=92647 RepID=UPI002AB767A7|nr:hypothetical protein [Paraburkholderia tropica]